MQLSTVFHALEVHPEEDETSEHVAQAMVALAQVTGLPVSWVARSVLALPDTRVDSLQGAIEASE